MNYKSIIHLGCSFTWSQDCGSNLNAAATGVIGYPNGTVPDDFHDEEKSYPAQLSKLIGIPYENHALRGNSNDAMLAQLYSWIRANPEPAEQLIIFNTTSLSRVATSFMADCINTSVPTDVGNVYSILPNAPKKRWPTNWNHQPTHSEKNDFATFESCVRCEDPNWKFFQRLLLLCSIPHLAQKTGHSIVMTDMLAMRQSKLYQSMDWLNSSILDPLENTVDIQHALYLIECERGLGNHYFKSAYSGHFTTEGYYKTAKLVYQQLQDQGYLK